MCIRDSIEEAHDPNDSKLTSKFELGESQRAAGQPPATPEQAAKTTHYTQMMEDINTQQRASILKKSNRQSARLSKKATLPPEDSQSCCRGCSIF